MANRFLCWAASFELSTEATARMPVMVMTAPAIAATRPRFGRQAKAMRNRQEPQGPAKNTGPIDSLLWSGILHLYQGRPD